MTFLQQQKIRKLKDKVSVLRQVIKLTCFDCLGQLADGWSDCKITRCPLYPFRLGRPPYSKNLQAKMRKYKSKFYAKK